MHQKEQFYSAWEEHRENLICELAFGEDKGMCFLLHCFQELERIGDNLSVDNGVPMLESVGKRD